MSNPASEYTNYTTPAPPPAPVLVRSVAALPSDELNTQMFVCRRIEEMLFGDNTSADFVNLLHARNREQAKLRSIVAKNTPSNWHIVVRNLQKGGREQFAHQFYERYGRPCMEWKEVGRVQFVRLDGELDFDTPSPVVCGGAGATFVKYKKPMRQHRGE